MYEVHAMANGPADVPWDPLKRWEDDIAKLAGKTWSTPFLARDWCKWKNKETAFTAAAQQAWTGDNYLPGERIQI
ncbi:jg4478 [Pararge aegeria aegeria]|uniref:Jg4478 protein n=1 Tax=Pararge aegeria aegeria TaxID=348720 RepID=A0A8S4SQX9_9NEOP|nr:jg4478 [Pararge aegeria aegeria]